MEELIPGQEDREAERHRLTDLWKKKISTIEYYALELCGYVIENYQTSLNNWEERFAEGDLAPPLQDLGLRGLNHTILTLQNLLGYTPTLLNFQPPRSLEDAFRDGGIEDQKVIDEHVKLGQEYFQIAEDLTKRASDLYEEWIQVTYDKLSLKKYTGEEFTPREKEIFEVLLDIITIDH